MVDSLAYSVEKVSGIPVYCGDHLSVLEEMDRNIRGARDPAWISITNTESMYHAKRIPSHRDYIEAARYSLCDGVGVVLAGWFQEKKIPRYNGPVLMIESCEYGTERGWRHFFCGGKEGVADMLATKLKAKFPMIEIAGTFCPPFRPMTSEEEKEMIRRINESNADVIWVGLGLLKQEGWIEAYHKRLNVPWLVGVGAAFDFHAGTARWAPAWIRKIGFEWLYRLFVEPRMFIRNYYSFVFLVEAIKKAFVMRIGQYIKGGTLAK